MRQIINYIKLSYKQLLWMVFLALFFLQFRVYYEERKFVNEVLYERDSLLDVNFMLFFYLFIYIPVLIKGSKIREKTKTKKSTTDENIATIMLIIYFVLLFFIKRIGTIYNYIFSGMQIIIITFLVLRYIDNKNKKRVLKVLPISLMKKQVAMGIISIIVVIIPLLSVESIVYVDKLLNSGDLAKLYSGSIKALFVVASFLCYRKFNVKKKREEDVTESLVYKTLKEFK